MAETAEREPRVVVDPEVKPGISTTEFWTSLGAMVAPLLTGAPPAVKIIVTGAVAVAYAIGRVVLKLRAGK